MCFHPAAIQVQHAPVALPPYLLTRQSNPALRWATLNTPLVLLSAPPGFGKSLLLQEWQQHCHQQGKRTALLRLHRSANHLPTLLAAIGRALRLPNTPHDMAALSDQVALGINRTETPQVLFIDNLETLQQRQSIAAIETLLHLAYHGVRVVLAGRHHQHLRLAQWRLTQQITLLNQQHLSVSANEACHVPAPTQAMLGHWPAAVFCLQQQRQPASSSALQNTLRLLNHYFDELLDSLYPANGQRLLMISALAPTFSEASLEFLSGQKNIAATLQQWQRDGLFMCPQGNSLAFAPLFRDYLRQRLQRTEPALAHCLRERAERYQQQQNTLNNSMPLANHYAFTGQEQRILEHIKQGKSNKDIANTLAISEGTVKWHLHNLYQKMQVSSRAQAILKATEAMSANHFKLVL